MATIPPDHREHLERRPFEFGCSTHIFPLDEFGALTERGNWMSALAAGKIAPLTAEHERFLKVDREEAVPATPDERAWVRLKGRRAYEREQEGLAAPEPAKDYGIVEWDKEKCWW
jgi:uncharacterized protein YifE (UPF0438 family)